MRDTPARPDLVTIPAATDTVGAMVQPSVSAKLNSRLALAAIAALLVTFAALAFFAVSSKSPTYDEPLHALGAWQHLWLHDFRVNPEDPPLWHYWAALPNGPHAIKSDTHSSDLFATVARTPHRSGSMSSTPSSAPKATTATPSSCAAA